ncbi:hypothetical protein NAP1_08987 [Erythrobacter sp. NAP1]|uniref:PilZ domain-containing protein n=1 Tax=Erythrobacter sp. NAP1 TaxID=237727 RepID=UPI0000685251|nr:PilZ domain-containing protein [Erythrobacter sp. NAP1]EAQ27716.1 hypothetical protein NAP1_08987 [Erythrobacter sp. NAP1]
MNRPSALLRKAYAPDDPIQVGRRGAPRLRLAIPAKLVSRYDTRRCILVDLSLTGAKVSLQDPLAKGEDALLQVGTLEPFGEVVRCQKGVHGGTVGLSFDPPLREADVLGVRAFAERYEEDEVRALRAEVRRWVTGV